MLQDAGFEIEMHKMLIYGPKKNLCRRLTFSLADEFLTTQGLHLMDQINLPEEMFRRLDLEVEPMMLEFECQRVLAESLGRYDYYCFLEDDCVIHDPWFFQKLQWFTKRFGNACLLQPNRYEVGSLTSAVRKLYPDGNLKVASTAKYQNLAEQPGLEAEYLDSTVRFKRPTNPHAGCYFLNAAQMKCWTNQPYFLDRSTEWIGPLESAATLGIMRTFRIYKPAAPAPEFLEVEHHGGSYLAIVGSQVPIESKGGRRKTWPFQK